MALTNAKIFESSSRKQFFSGTRIFSPVMRENSLHERVKEGLWLAKLTDDSQHSSGGSLVSPIGKKHIPLAGSAGWITKN
tara:strand:+ start:123 stop:362 length:240 start_codon:yes stop_codon:yes gene_type:complete